MVRLFGPSVKSIATRLSAVLEPGESLRHVAPCNHPERRWHDPRERIILTDRRILIVAAGPFDPFTMRAGTNAGPAPGQIMSLMLGDVVAVSADPATMRIVTSEVSWTTLATLSVRLRDGRIERVGLHWRDADAIAATLIAGWQGAKERLHGTTADGDGHATGPVQDDLRRDAEPAEILVPVIAVMAVVVGAVLAALMH